MKVTEAPGEGALRSVKNIVKRRRGAMGSLIFTLLVVFLAFAISAQPPLKSIEDGVLDKIQLFVATL